MLFFTTIKKKTKNTIVLHWSTEATVMQQHKGCQRYTFSCKCSLEIMWYLPTTDTVLRLYLAGFAAHQMRALSFSRRTGGLCLAFSRHSLWLPLQISAKLPSGFNWGQNNWFGYRCIEMHIGPIYPHANIVSNVKAGKLI